MNPPNTTWRKELTDTFRIAQDSFDNIEGNTMTDAQMDTAFNDGFGSSEGCSFTVWTKKNVYFPAVYNGLEWVEWAPRNPCDIATSHIGRE